MSKPTPKSAQAPEKKSLWKRYLLLFGGNSLLLSILLHFFFAVGATYFIVEHFQKKKHVNFQASGPPQQHNEIEHKVQLVKRNNVESAPPDLKRITTTEISTVTLTDVPEMPPVEEVTPTTISGVDGVLGNGMGNGMGGGGAGSGDGGMTMFGSAEGVGLVGTFYDMKQTADRKPTPIAAQGAELNSSIAVGGWETSPPTQKELQVLGDFVKVWDRNILNGYYKAPKTLQASQIFIPKFNAAEAPKAFGVQDTVEPRRWIVLYQAKIIPPKTGQFRFIGFADDFLVVRVGGRNVLDADWKSEKLVPSANVQEDVGQAPPYSGQPLYCGRWVEMEAGVPIDMEVLIGEGPGGDSSFFLFVQDRGKNYTKGDYPVFQLKDVPIPEWQNPGFVPPAFSKQKMVFGVAPPDATDNN